MHNGQTLMQSWDDLKFVLALSRHSTATAAARALGVNATTVTRRIQALEEQLGSQLFDRRAHGTTTTPAGDAAVAVAARMEQEAHNLDAEIRGLDEHISGRIIVASIDGLFALWRRDLAAFQRRYPNVELGFRSNTRPLDLSRREADVAIRFSPAPPEHLVGRRLCEVFFAVYVGRELAESMPQDASYPDYAWIGWGPPYESATDRVVAALAPTSKVGLRIDSMPVLERSIADGMGVSVLPCVVGDACPQIRRLGTYFEGGTYLWVLTHEQLRNTARIRVFMDTIAAAAERDTDLFLGRNTDPNRHGSLPD